MRVHRGGAEDAEKRHTPQLRRKNVQRRNKCNIPSVNSLPPTLRSSSLLCRPVTSRRRVMGRHGRCRSRAGVVHVHVRLGLGLPLLVQFQQFASSGASSCSSAGSCSGTCGDGVQGSLIPPGNLRSPPAASPPPPARFVPTARGGFLNLQKDTYTPSPSAIFSKGLITSSMRWSSLATCCSYCST